MLCRCASRVIGGVSLPEVLHCAHRSLCSSPPIEHTPPSPNHGTSAVSVGRSVYSVVRLAPSISTLSTLHPPQSRSDFKNSGSQSAPRKPPLRFGFSSHIGAFTAHRPAHSARLKGEFRGACAGCRWVYRDKGEAPPRNPENAVTQHFDFFNRLLFADFGKPLRNSAV